MINNAYIPAFLMIFSSLFLLSAYNWLPDKLPLRDTKPIQGGNHSVFDENLIGESSQILLVRNMNPSSVAVQVSALERKDGRWQSPFAPMDGVIGRNGFALPGEKRESDGRTPSGIFHLGLVFGYEHAFPTKMPYRQATVDDLWVDDVNADDYNRWVKRGTTRASSFERMRRNDDLYKYGIVLEYNTNPIMKGYGSAIFFHLWKGRGKSTEGCVAMSEEDIVKVLRWLDPAAKPIAVMGTNIKIGEY